jgi:hypothetical protein
MPSPPFIARYLTFRNTAADVSKPARNLRNAGFLPEEEGRI